MSEKEPRAESCHCTGLEEKGCNFCDPGPGGPMKVETEFPPTASCHRAPPPPIKNNESDDYPAFWQKNQRDLVMAITEYNEYYRLFATDSNVHMKLVSLWTNCRGMSPDEMSGFIWAGLAEIRKGG